MRTDPAGVAEEQRGNSFFHRLLETGNVGDEGGGREEGKDSANEFGEGGGWGAEKDEVGVGGERGGCSDFGLGKNGADGENGFGAAGADGDFGFGTSLGGGKGDGAADEARGDDGDFSGILFWVGRAWGRSSSRRDIWAGVPMEMRIQVGRW